jgi:dimethylargininase
VIALTREISPAIDRCELTHLARVPIDVRRAREQHASYEDRLRALGCAVTRLPADDRMPDSVFIEDIAVVVDELAILTRPGARSRRVEVDEVAAALRPYRELTRVTAPAIVDGGDVLTVGRRIFVGISGRTNREGAAQVRAALAPFGYQVDEIAVTGCLHLKSAVTALAEDAVLINRAWVDASRFDWCRRIDIDPREPHAANAVRAGGSILFPAEYPRTRDTIAAHGFEVQTVEAGELAKAEGAVTCCSVIFDHADVVQGSDWRGHP